MKRRRKVVWTTHGRRRTRRKEEIFFFQSFSPSFTQIIRTHLLAYSLSLSSNTSPPNKVDSLFVPLMIYLLIWIQWHHLIQLHAFTLFFLISCCIRDDMMHAIILGTCRSTNLEREKTIKNGKQHWNNKVCGSWICTTIIAFLRYFGLQVWDVHTRTQTSVGSTNFKGSCPCAMAAFSSSSSSSNCYWTILSRCALFGSSDSLLGMVDRSQWIIILPL